jgi:hypothetical protein
MCCFFLSLVTVDWLKKPNKRSWFVFSIWGRIFSRDWLLYEKAVSDLDPYRFMHRPIKVAHSLFIEGSHMTKIRPQICTTAKGKKRDTSSLWQRFAHQKAALLLKSKLMSHLNLGMRESFCHINWNMFRML